MIAELGLNKLLWLQRTNFSHFSHVKHLHLDDLIFSLLYGPNLLSDFSQPIIIISSSFLYTFLPVLSYVLSSN